MGCGSCGTSKDGAPSGCQSHGNCSSGGCNRMNVHDWLANLPFSDPESNCRVVEISFNNGSRKDYFKNTTLHYYGKGEMVAVEGVNGFDVGMVNLTGELVRLQLKKNNIDEKSPEIKKILRRATEQDIQKMVETKAKEANMLIRSRAIARYLRLELKMAEVEIQADAKKATFFYIADDRVDFRELIKLYAAEFKVKVEMRQIGARQEAGKVGGIGSCGRELCCSTWLTDFKSVNTNAARYQNLSINQTKLSGQCGRLKCCLNFELDTYMDALQFFPNDADMLELAKGRAFLIKKDIFKNLMWYTMSDSNKHYPLTIETVKRIKSQNKQGIRPEELETAEIITSKPKEVEPEYADLVGQISLKSLEKTTRKRRDKERSQQQSGPQNRGPQNQGNPRGQQDQNIPNQPNARGPQKGPQQNTGQNRGPQNGGNPNNRRNQGNRPNNNGPRNQQGQGPKPDAGNK
ncbi:MAG: regulatory iron-sulfur-containing complex subunit RicT [Sphingobacteriales bacterium]|nr:regulatory iron-sulfur-containing complex subunit RicT [Sphingobacteriales bacterium]